MSILMALQGLFHLARSELGQLVRFVPIQTLVVGQESGKQIEVLRPIVRNHIQNYTSHFG